MQRSPLRSSAILSAGYDPATCQLELEFRNGRIYRYKDVPPGVYAFLLRTPSKGGYVNRMIQDRYAFEEVTPEREEQDVLQALQASLEGRETDGG